MDDDAFLDTIRSSFPEIEIIGFRYLENPGVYQSTDMALDTSGLLIVSDFERKVISLMDTNGTSIDRIGGEGRGPGEFLAISELTIGPGGDLYVLDRTQYRVSRIRVSRDGLSLLQSDSYTTDGSLELEDLHILASGIFGVFGSIDDYETWENSYHLYRITTDYMPGAHLLELPGYDPLHLGQGMYMHNDLSSNTFWNFDGDYFFFTTSQSTEIHSYHLISGDHSFKPYMVNIIRPLSDSTRAYFRKLMAPYVDIFPHMDDPLAKVEQVPFTERISASGKYWILEMKYAGGGAKNILLLINRESGETGFIGVPRYFRSYGLIGKTLYGIDFEAEHRVMKLHLASLPE